MNFFSFISSNIIKWWQIHITPILHINNNKKGRDRFEGGDGSLQNHQAADLAEQTAGSTEQAAGTIGHAAGKTEQAAGTIGHAAESIERAIESGGHALNDAVTASDDVENVQGYMPSKKSAETHTINSDLLKHEIPKGTSADAMEVLNRINREKEEARKRAVEKQWKKRQEEERIAEIMNAGKVDVDAFIEEGWLRKKMIPFQKQNRNLRAVPQLLKLLIRRKQMKLIRQVLLMSSFDARRR